MSNLTRTGQPLSRKGAGFLDAQELRRIRSLQNISGPGVAISSAGISIARQPVRRQIAPATSGGGGSTPVKITTKVADPGKVWNCEVYASGVDAAKTADSTVRILQIDENAVFAVGEEPWLLATLIGDRYEGQIAVWLC